MLPPNHSSTVARDLEFVTVQKANLVVYASTTSRSRSEPIFTSICCTSIKQSLMSRLETVQYRRYGFWGQFCTLVVGIIERCKLIAKLMMSTKAKN